MSLIHLWFKMHFLLLYNTDTKESIQSNAIFQITMKPEIAPSLKQIINTGESNLVKQEQIKSNEITIGTSCKNGGCKETFNGPESNEVECIYHPGVPVFHEGLKFWSCCQKRTTDFNTFLSQVGCERGAHVWKKNVSSLD